MITTQREDHQEAWQRSETRVKEHGNLVVSFERFPAQYLAHFFPQILTQAALTVALQALRSLANDRERQSVVQAATQSYTLWSTPKPKVLATYELGKSKNDCDGCRHILIHDEASPIG